MSISTPSGSRRQPSPTTTGKLPRRLSPRHLAVWRMRHQGHMLPREIARHYRISLRRVYEMLWQTKRLLDEQGSPVAVPAVLQPTTPPLR